MMNIIVKQQFRFEKNILIKTQEQSNKVSIHKRYKYQMERTITKQRLEKRQ